MRLLWVLSVAGVGGCLEATPGYGAAGATGTESGSGAGSQDGASDDGDAGDSGTGADGGGSGSTETITTASKPGTSGASTGTTTTTSEPGMTTSEVPGPRAFATSTTTVGSFGGLSGGDDLCNERASAAGLGGTFLALLSDATTDVRDRIVLTEPLRNMVGDVVATDAADLWDGTLLATIDYDENGVELQLAALAWTGSAPDGTAASDCVGWTSAANSDFGMQGDLTATDSKWIANNDGRCNREQHLYCVEQ